MIDLHRQPDHPGLMPQISDGHPNHLGMVVMNFDLISSLAGKTSPAWEGVWTGITPTILATGIFDAEERFLALCHDEDGINRLYEIRKESAYDIDTNPIPTVLQTKAFAFESPYNRKELIGGDLWITEIYGPTTFTIKWRPAGYPEWTLWHTFTVCGDQGGAACSTGECVVLAVTPRARSRVILPRPPKACAGDGTHAELTFGYAFEFRIEWEGRASISRFRAHANRLAEDILGACDTENVCGSITVCPDNDFEYNLALETIGCADSVIFSQESEISEHIDLRPWRNTVVQGAVWIVEGSNGSGPVTTYLKGSVQGNRMLNLPEFVVAGHTTMELRVYCVDPNTVPGNSGFSGFSASG